MNQGHQDPGAAGAQGMAYRYCPTVNIYPGRVQFHPSGIFYAYHRKGLVHLPVIDILHPEP